MHNKPPNLLPILKIKKKNSIFAQNIRPANVKTGLIVSIKWSVIKSKKQI